MAWSTIPARMYYCRVTATLNVWALRGVGDARGGGVNFGHHTRIMSVVSSPCRISERTHEALLDGRHRQIQVPTHEIHVYPQRNGRREIEGERKTHPTQRTQCTTRPSSPTPSLACSWYTVTPNTQQVVVVEYESEREFARLAKQLGIMDDTKATVPRTAYAGVVPLWVGETKVYLAPRGASQQMLRDT